MVDIGGAPGVGGIYEDGGRVSEQLDDGESVTVPDGETWVVSIIGTTKGNSGVVELNGQQFVSFGDNTNSQRTTTEIDTVLKGGDTVKAASLGSGGSVQVGGWAL